MALRDLTNDNIRVRDLIDLANAKQDLALEVIDLVSWIDPYGNAYMGTRAEILEIVESGSWR